MAAPRPVVKGARPKKKEKSAFVELVKIVLGGLVGSSIVGVFAEDGPEIMGLHALSFLGFVLSGAFGLWLMWGVLRHGRL